MTDAWQTTVLDYKERLRALIRQVIGEDEGVEDVLQNVLMAAIRGGEQSDTVRDVEGWLCGLARNQARNHRRTLGRRKRHHMGLGEQRAVTDDPMQGDPLRLLLAGEKAEQVREAMAAMDTDDRAVLMMKYVERCRSDEIGKQLGLDKHAVTYRLRKARQRLREELIRRLPDEDQP